MNKEVRIAVIAGTPVDTQMGVDFLQEKGICASRYPVNHSPVEQVAFDVKPMEERMKKVQLMIDEIKKNGYQKIMVYCNSLSSTLDFSYLREKNEIFIVTPMDAYRKLATNFHSLGVIAGSNQALAGIEQVIMRISPKTEIYGVSLLSMVTGIERRVEPDRLVQKHGLFHLLHYFETNQTEAIVLGCTHFPYLKGTLEKHTKVSILDPANIIYELLMFEE